MRHPDLEARLAPLAYPGHTKRGTMKAINLCGQMLALSIGTAAAAVEDSVMKELVPTGKLRVAIAVSPARA